MSDLQKDEAVAETWYAKGWAWVEDHRLLVTAIVGLLVLGWFFRKVL